MTPPVPLTGPLTEPMTGPPTEPAIEPLDEPVPEPAPNPRPEPPRDLARTVFNVLVIGGLLAASLWVLRPFLGAAIWAAMIVVSTWPTMRWVQARLWNRRGPAVAVMTLALLLLFVVPLTLAIVTLVDNADRLGGWAKAATAFRLPERAPDWLTRLPLIGGTVEALWRQAAAYGAGDMLSRLSPYAGDLTRWFVAQVGGVGMLLLQFLLTVVIAAVFYAGGEEAAAHVRRVARRLGGEQGVATVALAAGAIRGVAFGVGGTAVAQAVLAAIGMALAGVPLVGLLTALAFMLCLVQVGPSPVLFGAAAWAFWSGSTGWGVFLVVWGLVIGTIDNVLRPLLIRLGADLPFLLIFAGVIGGVLAFGLVGIFVGPVVLAVAWTLLQVWIGARVAPVKTVERRPD